MPAASCISTLFSPCSGKGFSIQGSSCHLENELHRFILAYPLRSFPRSYCRLPLIFFPLPIIPLPLLSFSFSLSLLPLSSISVCSPSFHSYFHSLSPRFIQVSSISVPLPFLLPSFLISPCLLCPPMSIFLSSLPSFYPSLSFTSLVLPFPTVPLLVLPSHLILALPLTSPLSPPGLPSHPFLFYPHFPQLLSSPFSP